MLGVRETYSIVDFSVSSKYTLDYTLYRALVFNFILNIYINSTPLLNLWPVAKSKPCYYLYFAFHALFPLVLLRAGVQDNCYFYKNKNLWCIFKGTVASCAWA